MVGLGVVLLALLLAPASSTAVDSDLKFAYAFKVEASNGYSILAVASNERADGRGQIVLFVVRGDEGATYLAPALLTATSVRADLGALGKVDLAVAPTRRTKKLRSLCPDDLDSTRYELERFSGSFEFHGEQGYAEAVTSAPKDYRRFFYDILCSGAISGETGGDGVPGARLRLLAHREDFALDLRANKNGPGKRSRFEVEVHEKRGRVRISRFTTRWMSAGAFRYDRQLRTATLNPPGPFTGRATFHRNAAPANRLSGNLTVDLPGRSGVPLTGADLRATLVPSCWHEGRGGFGC